MFSFRSTAKSTCFALVESLLRVPKVLQAIAEQHYPPRPPKQGARRPVGRRCGSGNGRRPRTGHSSSGPPLSSDMAHEGLEPPHALQLQTVYDTIRCVASDHISFTTCWHAVTRRRGGGTMIRGRMRYAWLEIQLDWWDSASIAMESRPFSGWHSASPNTTLRRGMSTRVTSSYQIDPESY